MRVRTVVAVVIVGLVSLAGCSDDEEKASPKPEAAAAPSGPDSAHVLIHGTVTRGEEPMAGAQLWLTLMPDDQSDIEAGETVDTFDTQPVETDEDGSYAIELDHDELSSKHFNGEYLNFQVTLSTDDEVGMWHSTVWLRDSDYWRSDDRALVGDSTPEISFDLDGPTITVTDSYGETNANDFPTMRVSE